MKIKRAGVITKLLIFALIVYMGMSLIALKAQVAQAENTRAELAGKAAELSRTNAELLYEVETGTDPATKEAVARNKLGLVKPGEKIFCDIGG